MRDWGRRERKWERGRERKREGREREQSVHNIRTIPN